MHAAALEIDRTDLHPFYQVPVVHHRSTAEFSDRGAARAIHTIDLGPFPLHAYLRIGQGDQLTIGFHGAIDRDRKHLPFFERFASSDGFPGSVLLLCDASLYASPTLRLAWYLGLAEADLEPHVHDTIAAAVRASGATRLVFHGSSGGGFAALKFASRYDGATAFVINPQTDATRYFERLSAMMLDACFGGISIDEARIRYSDRMSCVARYASARPRTRIYYLQNRSDRFHLEQHMKPFQQAIASLREDGVRFVVEDFGQGHAPPPADVHDHHFRQALAMN